MHEMSAIVDLKRKIFDFKLTLQQRLNNDTNNLRAPFDVHTNDW